MSWWAWFGVLVSAGGLVASILGAWMTFAARWNGEATRALTRTLTLALAEQTAQQAQGLAAQSAEQVKTLSA
jgi:hypothetical protein